VAEESTLGTHGNCADNGGHRFKVEPSDEVIDKTFI
jgi:hypothetical protein